MLILTVREGESIFIGGHLIVVKVCRINRGQVKLGVRAPRVMPVHREDVQERIDRQEERSA